MGVYTKVSNAEITEFLKSYSLGDFISLTDTDDGIENTNYVLKTEQGQFILTLYERLDYVDELAFFMDLTEHLSHAGLPVPNAVKNNNGEPLGDLCGRRAAIVEFLNGQTLGTLTPEHCYNMGEMLAKMHVKGFDFKHQRPNPDGQGAWQGFYDRCDVTQTLAFNPLIPDMVEDELHYLQTAWPHHLPTGIVHADAFPDNVLFDENNHISGMIDFYAACTDILAYDLAICLNSWCFDDFSQMNTEKANKMIAGYQSIRPLSSDEKNAMNTLMRGGAILFFLCRLYDWYNTPDDVAVQRRDPNEYMQILQFHRANLTVADYGLIL